MIFLEMLHNCDDIVKNVRKTIMIFFKIVIETIMILLEMSEKLS